jgi:hypothetical protein
MSLDPAQDPDRYDLTKDSAPTSPLDPALDPDRFHDPTLPELLGANVRDDDAESPLAWVYGLVGVFGFLAFVTALIYLR